MLQIPSENPQLSLDLLSSAKSPSELMYGRMGGWEDDWSISILNRFPEK